MSLHNVFVSQRRKEFADYPDSEIEDMLESAEQRRLQLCEDADNGEDDESAIDEIDRLIFKLDDELCARGL